jgi:hypothetical protein
MAAELCITLTPVGISMARAVVGIVQPLPPLKLTGCPKGTEEEFSRIVA